MKKIILVDGNNLMFRSYYATAYTGNLMKNSKGKPTNALYGFINMINKIIEEEKPTYMAVAFDVGKNFRHDKYNQYKSGRQETPSELKEQLKEAPLLLEAMGIKHYEVPNYEADDIIGTISNMALINPNFIATIVSSDKDLLQLINKEVEVKLLKSKDYIRYDENTFKADYGIEPITMIDLKALMGDPSDNVPGVKGIGEKTALKLLQEYKTLENIYNNINNIKGSLHDKLVSGKESAFFSKEICTIYLNVPINEKIEDMIYLGPTDKLAALYEELEFYSFLKKIPRKEISYYTEFKELKDANEISKDNPISYYIESSNINYHKASIIGMGVFDGNNLFYVEPNKIEEVMDYLKNTEKYTYDLKKNMVLLNNLDLFTTFDHMIASYLLNYQVKEDIAVLMNKQNIEVPFYESLLKDNTKLKDAIALKAKYIYDTKDNLISQLKLEDMIDLFNDIEMPLIRVLAKMELNGIYCDKNVLNNLKLETTKKIGDLTNRIHECAKEEFNISSPKQLGIVLFDKMKLPYYKKKSTAKSYSTDAQTLEKLINVNPIIPYILEYRNLTKINSTYLEGLENYILDNGKIHTIYKQALTRTGRLSSAEPNLQNIPTREENGKQVRKAFVPSHDLFLSADYSQIELRILAHISDSKELIASFKNGEDIHRTVASDIFEVEKSKVTKEMRKAAKAVIFGIVYGISGFGLGENLNLNPKDAKKFIDKYFSLYPSVKKYMDDVVKEAYMYGSVRTMFNRKRIIDELSNANYMIRSSGERIALNTPIQGSSADIIKLAMIKIDQEMESKQLKSKMILQVHDELVFDVTKEEKNIMEEIVKNNMENIVKLNVPLKIEIDYGTNWYDAK